LNITSQINSLSLKNQDSELLKGKLKKLDLCPTCLQNVDDSYKANVINKLEVDISQNVKNIEISYEEKRQISDKLNKIDVEISLKEKEVQELKILKVRIENLEERKKRLKELQNSNIMLEKDTLLLSNQVKSLNQFIFNLGKYGSLYEEIQNKLDLALREERIADIKVAELKKEIEVFSNQIEELKIKVFGIEKIKKELHKIVDLENWLTKIFSSVVSFIEKNVMVKLKSEFSKLFQEWFSMLVTETFNVRLSDDFTPIIEQHDYEIDYAYLSGGERTAIALAYRLSLNQVINSILSKIKTRDFVILDEPTDGFSEQQLDKMREILEQLDVAQLIIVSHEQKIEGFVENVIRFKKENGISKKV